jgi:hypothetical protein
MAHPSFIPRMTQRASNLITVGGRASNCSLIWLQQCGALPPKVMEGIKKYASGNLLETRFRPVMESGEIEIKQSSVRQIISEI